ncbi:hypothetical protein CY34DRAFT_238144 [Suillus luteus UH-Slu-Lm8-n1]|uniref:Unplaced genomic scaffold CY34scaffold_153, whole genome shotgun sequence n=1 Tax=Suillus luteus UH-Slu-Lm8-n1 TaxID=930992 RepID=A0A0C9ZSZ2_9AGAM|nr:hypothetical protein CY34DRAFT_238144 [Suillus luteus UH-Slu-Lm8-n1]
MSIQLEEDTSLGIIWCKGANEGKDDDFSSLRKQYLSKTSCGQAIVDETIVDGKVWTRSVRHSACHYRCFCSFAWICPFAYRGLHPQHSTYSILGFDSVIRNRTCRPTEKKSRYTNTCH